ncbi:hypothetical protein [Thermotoga sp. KOL6]|uniref:hypothetical protein n=1 Tax=Thermotoga sp. KOL6 TaxID=126741 RepID=UPI000C78564C|nr:hypothetical protein [Thermotoga sp. KOL6]PLV58378.1 hypothetical protein AS005_08420 [Thermotoga sp. KOL6]
MLRRIVALIKKWFEGFFLELKGPKVSEIVFTRPSLDVKEEHFDHVVTVCSLKNEPKVKSEIFRQEEILVEEVVNNEKITCHSEEIEILAVESHLSSPIEMETNFHSENFLFSTDIRSFILLEPKVFSNNNIKALKRIMVRRETKVDKKKMEGALKVLLSELKEKSFDRVSFVGYYRNVPSGKTTFLHGNLLVEAEKGTSRDLMVFEIIIKGTKKYIFIAV